MPERAPELPTPPEAPAAGTTGTPATVGGDGDRPANEPVRRRIALVGNPNVGKSVLFNALTGTYATVSNYPGTTVEVTRATARFDPNAEIVDTPGVNSLTPNSEDEAVTRDILLSGVDAVIQVADAKNLVRGLAISAQLAEAQVPFLLVLNMIDEAADRGVRIDTERLSAELGVPVVATVAVSGYGVREIGQALPRAAAGSFRTAYPVAVEHAVVGVSAAIPRAGLDARSLALMLLAGDDTLRSWLRDHVGDDARTAIESAYQRLRARTNGHAGFEMQRARLRGAEELADRVTQRLAASQPNEAAWRMTIRASGVAAVLGWLLLLAGDSGLVAGFDSTWVRAIGWAGIAFPAVLVARSGAACARVGRWASESTTSLVTLAIVLYVLYRFVGVFAAGDAVDFFEETVFGGWINPFVTRAVDAVAGRLAPAGGSGAAAVGFVRDALVGPYGMVTVALTYALAIIFPIVTAFFLTFSVLEDSGYLPRLAVVVNRVFKTMGLNGKAVLPMVLGLGCDTMATLTTRIMETKKERVITTLLLALGVPCSAQLGVILGLFGALPLWAPLVWCGVVLGVLFAVGYLSSRVLPGESSDLILEIPPIRAPQASNILLKTAARLEWYLREAVPIFVFGTAVLFLLDKTGALAWFVRASEPLVVGLLNLPARAAEAFLVGFFRRDYGSAGIYAMFQQGQLSAVQAVVSLVTITLFVPCVANFFVIVKERGLPTALAMTGFIFPFAFFVGALLNFALRGLGLG